jgi:hypothetical protein
MKARAVLRIAICSSEKAKSTVRTIPVENTADGRR